MAATRTSGRTRTATKKYNVDPFAGLEDLIGDTAESEENGLGVGDGESDESDAFDANAAAAEDEDDNDDDEDEAMPGAVAIDTDNDSDELAHLAEPDDEEVIDVAQPPLKTPKKRTAQAGPRRQSTAKPSGNSSVKNARAKEVKRGVDPASIPNLPAFDKRALQPPAKVVHHTRGIPDYHHSNAKSMQILYTFGDGHEDLAAYLKMRNQFYEQLALPSRNPQTRKRERFGGLALSSFYSEGLRAKEKEVVLNWYAAEGRGHFQAGQSTMICSPMDIDREDGRSPLDPILLGPVSEPRLYKLQEGEVLDLQDAWQVTHGTSGFNGWLLNVGKRVQCLSWIPNHASTSQYLCIVKGLDRVPVQERDVHNAFAPQEGFPSAMEIWEFHSESKALVGARPDKSTTPKLKAVVHWDWGDMTKMQWCPVDFSPANLGDVAEDGNVHLGLMGGVWRDGCIRVLDLSISSQKSASPQHIKITRAAFESRPPTTVCTSLSWLSTTSIAAGCANGNIAIWNLERCLADPADDSSRTPRPWFYHKFHDTYVLNVVSCYPSRPHILLTQAVDGITKMTDIRSPVSDVAQGSRSRVAIPSLAWFDQYQIALSTDENCSLNYKSIRRFYQTSQIHRLSALVTDIAVSPVHPCVMYSCADGSIWCTNPLRRARNQRVDGYAQIWFRHEWRRSVKEFAKFDKENDTMKGDSDLDDATPFNGTITTPGNEDLLNKPLIRFVEGFKPVQMGHIGGKRMNNEGLMLTTIHEEKSAVTQVSWNPNIRCGTWAAAGMADGLVRVEDIGID